MENTLCNNVVRFLEPMSWIVLAMVSNYTYLYIIVRSPVRDIIV